MIEDQIDSESGDREISLSPGIVLGVFLALALVCAVFFGFGYSVGRRSVPPSPSVSEVQPTPVVGGSKPAPGSFAAPNRALKNSSPSSDDHAADRTAVDVSPTTSSEKPVVQRPSSSSVSNGGTVTTSIAPAAVAKPTTTFHAPAVVTPPSVVSSAPSNPVGASIVQVAAFSHQQDAELVAGALRKRGYDVTIRQQSQDSLLHVQLGPFGSKKEADAMRQRLQADGYNAIVK